MAIFKLVICWLNYLKYVVSNLRWFIQTLFCSKQLDDNDAKTPTPSVATATNSSGKKKSSKHHKVHAIPIAEDAACPPASYQYRVKMDDGSLRLVNANTLRSEPAWFVHVV